MDQTDSLAALCVRWTYGEPVAIAEGAPPSGSLVPGHLAEALEDAERMYDASDLVGLEDRGPFAGNSFRVGHREKIQRRGSVDDGFEKCPRVRGRAGGGGPYRVFSCSAVFSRPRTLGLISSAILCRHMSTKEPNR
jgi:hypothetical protein